MVWDRVAPWASYAMAGLLAAGGVFACNLEEPKDDDDDDGGSASASSDDGSTAAGFVGSGGSTSTAGNGGAGQGPASSTASSVVASSSATGGDCMYPAGPYSVAQGGTVPQSISWQGRLAGEATASTINLSDFFDCDGTKGVNAILVDTSQYG